MILRYIYQERNGSKQLVGCVVLTDEGKLGYSAVHPKDRRKMSKKLARTIAMGRAEKCDIYGILDGPAWYCMRNGMNGRTVPPVVVPHLAALAGI